jgi:hypothetical protein
MAIDIEIDSSGLVKKSAYTPAHSILVQQSGTGSPTALQVGNNTLVGRLSGDGSLINDLSATDVKTMLDIQISDVEDLQTSLDAKQPSGDYATNTALSSGLATKQPSGDYATNTALSSGLATKQPLIAPLMPYDYWYETRFQNTNNTQAHLAGFAISSGTSSAAVPVLASNTLYPYGVFLRSATSVNGGFKFNTSLINTDFFGGVAKKFQTAIMWKTSFTGRTVRVGYHDSGTNADATDGAYFEILDNVVNCKTSDNSVRTTVTMVTTLSIDEIYLFDIESNTAGTLITYKLINANTNVVIETATISTNIPTATTRGFGVSLVATEATTTSSDICVIYYVGNGTVNGFNRQRN